MRIYLVESNKICIFVSVKQQVKDINETLSAVLAELQEQRKTIDSQHAEICSLNRNVDKLLKENRELRKRLAKYEKPPKDSGNSSTPPSKEPIKSEIERRTKSLREKSDKPVGGQKGHEGTTLKIVDIPDEIEEVKSLYCKNCGRDLSEITPELERASQEIDLPQVRHCRHACVEGTSGCSIRMCKSLYKTCARGTLVEPEGGLSPD